MKALFAALIAVAAAAPLTAANAEAPSADSAAPTIYFESCFAMASADGMAEDKADAKCTCAVDVMTEELNEREFYLVARLWRAFAFQLDPAVERAEITSARGYSDAEFDAMLPRLGELGKRADKACSGR